MELIVRPAEKSDDHALQPRRLQPSDERTVLVAQYGSGPAVVGAIAVTANLFESVGLDLPVADIERAMSWSGHRRAYAMLLEGALDVLRKQGTKLVVFRVPETERRALDSAQEHGFSVMECQLTLARPLDETPEMPEGIVPAEESDADACAEIAAAAFRQDRFHVDPAIQKEAADRHHGHWARARFDDADLLLVARDEDTVVGFIACLRDGDDAVIDLLAVAPDKEGKGWGKRLIDAAAARYGDSAARLTAATQTRNIGALAALQARDFRITRSTFICHAHL